MDHLTRKMLNDLANTQKVLPDLRTTRMMLNAFADVKGILPDHSTMQMITRNFVSTQELFSNMKTAQAVLNSLTNVKPLMPDLNITQQLFTGFSNVSRLLPDLSVTQKLLADFAATQTTISDVVGASHLATSLEAIALTHVSLANLSWKDIGGAIRISDELRITLGDNFLRFSDTYLHLCQSIGQSDLKIAAFPTLTFELPAIEFFNGTDLLEAVTAGSVEDQYLEEKQSMRHEISVQIEDELEILLATLDANLVRLWRGANQSLNSSNEDHSRHFLMSLRELLTHVLQKLAPDTDVSAWTTSPEHFDKGRPTRKARLLFICRDINLKPFSSFMEKDIASVLSFWEVLNRAHEIAIPFTQRQLNVFKIRMEGALRLLLVTWKSSK